MREDPGARSVTESRRRFLVGLGATAGFLALGPSGLLVPDLAGAAADTYPYPNANMNAIDPWYFYYRNCTSYCAWKINEAGRPFTNQTGGGRFGDAANWDDNARLIGWTTSTVAKPRSVAVSNAGHVAWVESVNADGSVNVSEYNQRRDGRFGTRSNVRFDVYIEVPGVTGTGDLYFVKTKNTGSGKVEAHTATAASGYLSGISSASRFSPSEHDKGWFRILPDLDLAYVKTKSTGSGKVEIHTVSKSSGYASGVSSATRFSPADASNGWFGALPNRDVYFVKTRNTGSGKVEVHTATASSGYAKGVSKATRFKPADQSNGWFGVLSNGDVYFVKTRNTGSGKVEVHTATASSGYAKGVSKATRFKPADQSNGWFGVLSNGDVYFVKTRNTGSGKVEVHTATASSGYASGVSKATRFKPADQNNGWFGLIG